MNELEIRLQDIDNRLKKLEKIERNRRIFGVIKLVITFLLIIVIIVYGIFLYNEFSSKIGSFKDIINNYQDYNYNYNE